MTVFPSLLKRLRADRRTQLLLTRYVAIGAFVFCVDVTTFGLLLRAGLILPAATSLSFLLAMATHFTLNRFVNFRNFERTIVQQLGTYLMVAAVTLVLQNIAVLFGVYVLGFPPLLAKIAGIGVNLPFSFLGHRYLTFGSGVAGAIRRWRKPTADSPGP